MTVVPGVAPRWQEAEAVVALRPQRPLWPCALRQVRDVWRRSANRKGEESRLQWIHPWVGEEAQEEAQEAQEVPEAA
jgi:hypothetical protein